MVTYDFTGVVDQVGDTKAFGQNGFTKRDLIVDGSEPQSKYPNPVQFTFKKDRCALCDTVKKGDRVKIQFTIDGRRWDGPNGTRYFTDLTGWKIENLNEDGTSVEAVPAPAEPPVEMPATDDSDNLPF